MAARLARNLVIPALALSAGAAAAQHAWQPAQDRGPPQWPAPQGGSPPAPRPPIELQTLKDIFLAMEVCWQANLPARLVPGMTVNVLVSFKRNGEMFGEPQFKFVTPGVPTETKALYQRAAVMALNSCNPLPFSEGLGNAVAGRPAVFQFIDRRTEKGT